MKIVRLFAVIAMALNFVTTANAKQLNYLCIADLSTGFKLENGKWDFARFDVSKEKLLVKQEAETENYQVVPFGSASASHRNCEMIGNTIICGGQAVGFILNTETLRFQEIYGIGYVHGDILGNTPSLTIGRCSQL